MEAIKAAIKATQEGGNKIWIMVSRIGFIVRKYTSLGMTLTTSVFSWAQSRPALNADRTDTQLKGEKNAIKETWVSRTGRLRKLPFGRVVAGWRRGPAHKTGATEVRHAISVFESAFNLMCDVEEGYAPLSTDFPHGGQREKHGLL